MRRILLSVVGNSGHEKAARAIETALHETDPAVVTSRIDPVRYAHPRIGTLRRRELLGAMGAKARAVARQDASACVAQEVLRAAVRPSSLTC